MINIFFIRYKQPTNSTEANVNTTSRTPDDTENTGNNNPGAMSSPQETEQATQPNASMHIGNDLNPMCPVPESQQKAIKRTLEITDTCAGQSEPKKFALSEPSNEASCSAKSSVCPPNSSKATGSHAFNHSDQDASHGAGTSNADRAPVADSMNSQIDHEQLVLLNAVSQLQIQAPLGPGRSIEISLDKRAVESSHAAIPSTSKDAINNDRVRSKFVYEMELHYFRH